MVWTSRNKQPRIIGTKPYVHIPSQRRKKMDKKEVNCYVAWYDGDERYRVYINTKNIVEISRYVIFPEENCGCPNVGNKKTRNSTEENI